MRGRKAGEGRCAQILKDLEDQASSVRKGEPKNLKKGLRREFLVTPPLLAGCPLPDTQAGGPPTFPSGGTADLDGQGRPRGLRSCTSWPRTLVPRAQTPGIWLPAAVRYANAVGPGSENACFMGTGRPVLRDSRRPPSSFLGPRRSWRPLPAHPSRSAPPLST